MIASGPERGPAPGEGRRIIIAGTVQGVGFRPFVFRLAQELGVRGRVRNDAGGVSIDAFGSAAALDAFAARLRSDRPPAAVVEDLRSVPIAPEAVAGFEIVESGGAAERRTAIPPDLATCADCLREIADPADRRHRYPFTNCTNCGPRFTIAQGAPYDRPATTMARFAMCPACAREYGDPRDRRFHAQPNACPACGPRVSLRDARGSPISSRDPVGDLARALAAGRIAAVKGIGGYHLACDATSPAAVRLLRDRKRREEKPLAVMVRDVDAARALAALGSVEEALLSSVERPIVLCRRRPGAALAAEIAPDSPLVGLMLPYAPLHHLVLEAAGVPLVMTSGNLSEEPIAFEDEDALARLGGIADLFLVHDRPIASRCDDSVARAVGGRRLVMRRARGFVPRPVRISPRLRRPVLAVGAQLKNAFCLGRGEEAVLGPHVGDLDNLETYAAFEAAIDRLEGFLALRPEAVSCDLHPQYLSTRYARERAAALGAPLVEVQHHHAHAAALMAERHLNGPVLALAWDGTGLGTDGTAWGGELLLAERGRFQRLATLRPLALAGGDRAIREPWRIALAALLDAFGADAPLDRLPLFRSVDAKELDVVRRMIAARVNAPLAHGAGRAFDAAGALALGRAVSRYEGQVAMALDNAADPPSVSSLQPSAEAARGDALAAGCGLKPVDCRSDPYPFDLDTSGSIEQLDLRPLWRALAADVAAGAAPALVSARFHAALVRGGAELVRRAAARTGVRAVGLTGGCFQNARLAEGLVSDLSGALEVYTHVDVPPGDGGIALGQAIVADATAV